VERQRVPELPVAGARPGRVRDRTVVPVTRLIRHRRPATGVEAICGYKPGRWRRRRSRTRLVRGCAYVAGVVAGGDLVVIRPGCRSGVGVAGACRLCDLV